MYFKDYGQLEWIEPEAYYMENYKHIDTAEGEDGQKYEILMATDTETCFYTNA